MTVSTSYKGHPALSDQDWGFSTISEMPATMNPAPSRMFYVYLAAPAIILLAAITIYPFLWLIYMSFHKVGFGAAGDVFVGVENFSRLFSDARYIEGWGLLAKYSAICLSIQVVVGVTLAVVLNNSRHEKVLVTLF